MKSRLAESSNNLRDSLVKRHGALFCLYDVTVRGEENRLSDCVVTIINKLGIEIDTLRLSQDSGRAVERPFEKDTLTHELARGKSRTFLLYAKSEKNEDQSPIYVGRFVEIRNAGSGGHVIIFDRLSSVDGFCKAGVFGDLCTVVHPVYGFGVDWDGVGGSPWGFAFGAPEKSLDEVLVPDRAAEIDLKNWGREYFYKDKLFEGSKLRDVYRVNILSLRFPSRFKGVKKIVDMDPSFFGRINVVDSDTAFWCVQPDKIEPIRRILRDRGLLI